jgi:hypothetical protein
MNLTQQQADRLTRAHAELGAVLTDLGILKEDPKLPVAPQWMQDTAKQWALLSDLEAEHDGDVGSQEWARLGRQHGYDPRGLGGFFVGSQPLMASQGERRVLTSHGRRFIERWRADFEVPHAA